MINRRCTVCGAYDGFHSRRAKGNHRVCLPSHKGERASQLFDAAVLIAVDERGQCQFHAALRDKAEAAAQKVPVT